MSNKLRILTIFIFLVFVLASTSAALASPLTQSGGNTISGDQVIFGDSFLLQDGQTLNGDLVVIGGNAEIESNATVNGDIAILGGNLDLAGAVNGTVAAIGANVSMTKGAFISGELVNLGGAISGVNLATVRGGIRTFTPRTFFFDKDVLKFGTFSFPNDFANAGSWLVSFLGRIMQILAMAVLAVIVLLVMPNLTKNVAGTAADQPWMSGGAGLLTFLATPLVLLILIITIILIPVAILLVLALAVAAIFGWIALGYELGKRLAALFKTEWADPVSGGVGTLVLGITVGLLSFIPCLGAIIRFLIICAGLGGVILSAFGTRPSSYTKPTTAPLKETLPDPSPPPTSTADTKPPERTNDRDK